MSTNPVNKERLLRQTQLLQSGMGGVVQFLLDLEGKVENTPSLEVIKANLRGEKGDSYVLTEGDKGTIVNAVSELLDRESLKQEIAVSVDALDFDTIIREVSARVEVPENGKDGEDGMQGDNGKDGERGEDGESVSLEDLHEFIEEKVGKIVLPENTSIDIEGRINEIKKGLGGSTARNFYQLTDTPQGYVGFEGFDVRVNEAGTGLEFYDKTAEGIVHNYVEVSATYTILVTDVTVNCTANTFTATLPTAVGVTGQKYYIKNSGTGLITVEGDGTETIDDELNQVLAQYEALTVISTGSDWIIV